MNDLTTQADLHASQAYQARRWGWRMLQLAIVLAVLTPVSLALDMSIASYWQRQPLSGDLKVLIDLSEAFSHGLTVIVLMLFVTAIDDRSWRLLPRMMYCTYGAGLIVNIIKMSVGRMRPSALESFDQSVTSTFIGFLPSITMAELAEEHGHRLQSFPSGHTATAVGFTAALAILYPRRAWVFAILPVLAAVQRMKSESHFLSDTFAAAAIALACAASSCLIGPVSRWFLNIEANKSRQQST